MTAIRRSIALEPPIGLASVPTLLERHHAAGMTVDMQVDGSPRPLAPGLDQAAYRILQESLTNAARHGTGPVAVRIAYGQRQLELTISNATNGNGAGAMPARPATGSSACASAPRCSAAALHAGARDGVFRVTAHLPYAAAARAPVMSAAPIRVLLVDDDELMRAGLAAVLSSDPTIEVVGQASTGRLALERARAVHPDLVLMDVRMPDLDGIAATRRLLAAAPEVKVIILTTFEQDDYIFDAIDAGASGFLLKRTRPEELLSAIHAVAAGDSLLSPSVTRIVLEHLARQPTLTPESTRQLAS